MKASKYTNSLDVIITKENVKTLGENIALYTLKNLMPYRYKELAPLYYGLIGDLKRMNDYTRTITEGYDLAQTAICFLCAYMGRKLSDKVIGKYGKPVNIIHACCSEVANYIYRRRKYSENVWPILETDKTKTIEPFEEEDREGSYERVEEIIAQMHLSKKQEITLECYMQGMGVTQIARLLHVANSTVWRSSMALQRKYNALN